MTEAYRSPREPCESPANVGFDGDGGNRTRATFPPFRDPRNPVECRGTIATHCSTVAPFVARVPSLAEEGRDERVAQLCARCRGQGALLVDGDGQEQPLPTFRPPTGGYGFVCPDCKGNGHAEGDVAAVKQRKGA